MQAAYVRQVTELQKIPGTMASSGLAMNRDDLKPDGWRMHEAEQLRAWMRTSCLDRLRWLDQAKRFAALALEAAEKRRAQTTEAPA